MNVKCIYGLLCLPACLQRFQACRSHSLTQTNALIRGTESNDGSEYIETDGTNVHVQKVEGLESWWDGQQNVSNS